MPSGAKKRKAAKKKLQKKVHSFTSNNNNNNNTGSDSLSQGSDDQKYNERDNGGVEISRDGNDTKKNYEDESTKDVRLVEGNGVREETKKKGENNKSSTSSSSSSSNSSRSSSDSDEVEDRSQEPESGKVDTSVEHSHVSDVVVNEAVEESIPLKESVKQVVSLPQVSIVVNENVDEKIEVASKMENLDEGLLPQSSGAKSVEGCCADNDCKASQTHKSAEEQPLLLSAPVTVRRTSWFDCCGLFEVFSGGSSR